jgi:hypothetical protein
MTDDEYDRFLRRVGDGFAAAATNPLFTVSTDGLWELYLEAFQEHSRQYHNCNTCRAFVERFGGLVTIDEYGQKTSAVWGHDAAAGTAYQVPFTALRTAVENATSTVNGVFLSSEKRLGEQRKGRRDKARPESANNVWSHLFVDLPDEVVFRSRLLTAGQAMAEKREDWKTVSRALSEFSLPLLDQALELLRSDALYRSEKVLGPVQWLRDLKAATEESRNNRVRRNLIWRAIATAPAGFCHPRSSVAGTLLEDLGRGDFEFAARRFKAKMHPLQYQRPQAAPSTGQVEAAEKLVEKLGIARSLERRFARLDEIQTFWTPRDEEADAPRDGVFGHLKPGAKREQVTVPAKPITWEKFEATVLPGAKCIEVLAPGYGNYCAFLTALHDDAPPIHQWDSEERRNPFSLYVYHGGSGAAQWGIVPGWAEVAALSRRPCQWQEGFGHHSKGVLLVLRGCVDSQENQGNALFPETLRSELHGARPVIEAYSRAAKIHGRDQASACGLMVSSETRNVSVRVHGNAGVVSSYTIDRWE